MQENNLIPAKDFCSHHHIEVSFIHSLHDYGLIDITTTGEDCYLQAEQLDDLEKMVRLYYDLHINLEGIDVIRHLLQRMEELQREMNELKNKLRVFEPPRHSDTEEHRE